MNARQLINKLIDELSSGAFDPDKIEVVAEENKTGESFPIQDIQVWGNKIRLEVDLNEGQEDEEESGEDEEQSEASHH